MVVGATPYRIGLRVDADGRMRAEEREMHRRQTKLIKPIDAQVWTPTVWIG